MCFRLCFLTLFWPAENDDESTWKGPPSENSGLDSTRNKQPLDLNWQMKCTVWTDSSYEEAYLSFVNLQIDFLPRLPALVYLLHLLYSQHPFIHVDSKQAPLLCLHYTNVMSLYPPILEKWEVFSTHQHWALSTGPQSPCPPGSPFICILKVSDNAWEHITWPALVESICLFCFSIDSSHLLSSFTLEEWMLTSGCTEKCGRPL